VPIFHDPPAVGPDNPDAQISTTEHNAPHRVTSVNYTLVDPENPQNGEQWYFLVSSSPLTIEERMRVNGVTVVLSEIVNPRVIS
jgi:hypothetical protein